MALRIISSFFLILFLTLFLTVQGRSVRQQQLSMSANGSLANRLSYSNDNNDELNYKMISDGVEEHHGTSTNNQSLDHQFIMLGGPRLSDEAKTTCEHAYGFFPCAENIPGYVFQIVIFQYLMDFGGQLVSGSSKKIFDTLGTGVFGATVFRLLMVFPRIIMTIASGIFNSKEGAQNQVFFGIRVNSGTTIFNLTILWGLCVIVGRKNQSAAAATQESDVTSSLSPTKSSQSFVSKLCTTIKEHGISTDISTCLTAGIMLISLVPFVFVELVNVVTTTLGDHIVILIGLIITVAFLLAYFAYQIKDPWIQTRSLQYSRFENLLTENGKPNIPRIRQFFHLYDSNNNNEMSRAELEKFLRSMVSEEVQRLGAVRTLMKDFNDDNGDNEIDEDEFIHGLQKLFADNGNTVAPSPTVGNGDQKTNGDQNNNSSSTSPSVEDKKPVTWDFIAWVLQVTLGVAILTFCAQPLMTNVINFSDAVGVPIFFISFVVIPVVINGRQALAAISQASQKSSTASSLTFSEIYNGVTMSNLTGLLSLLAVVYARDLIWDYSAEVFVVLVISLIIGFLAWFNTTYQLWTSIFAFFLYPFSLALFYLLQTFFGWD